MTEPPTPTRWGDSVILSSWLPVEARGVGRVEIVDVVRGADDEDDQNDPNADDLGDTSTDEPELHRERHPFPAYSPSVTEADGARRQNSNPRRHLLHRDLSHEFDKGTILGSKDLTAEFENLDALSIRAE